MTESTCAHLMRVDRGNNTSLHRHSHRLVNLCHGTPYITIKWEATVAYLNNELETEVLYRHTDENEHTLKL